MKFTDPARMSCDDVMAEIGEILAAGIQRFLARECDVSTSAKISADRLDVVGDVEAPCDATTESPG